MKKSRANYMREWRARKRQKAIDEYMAMWGPKAPIPQELRNIESGADPARARRFLELLRKHIVFSPVIDA